MSIFSKPYPKDNSLKKSIILSLFIGGFVFVFLFLFQPFALDQWKIDHKTLRLLGYGLISSFVILFNGLIIEKIFSSFFAEKNWKVWKQIGWSVWNIFLIGTLNLIYSHYQGIFSINIHNFLGFQWITILIGLFPVTLITLINYSRLQHKNLEAAQKITHVIESDVEIKRINDTAHFVSLSGENAKEELKLNPEDLFFIESADNYVEVSYMENGQLQKKLLRNTLKNMNETLLKETYLFRCHRSFIVNLYKVVKVLGNSQGYKLHLSGSDALIPVSRSLNDIIQKKIEEIHK